MNTTFSNFFIWVLAPHLESSDSNIGYYYDFTQSISEYTATFKELNIEWKWQPVTISNFTNFIDAIVATETPKQKLILNLCDGDEINGTPGVSVIHYLDEKQLLYTGSDAYFYNITTSKFPMKMAFDKSQVSTAKWRAINTKEDNFENLFNELGTPIILKPAISGGSMGVSIKNVVHTKNELQEQVKKMFNGYRGWQLTGEGIIAEAFIDGPEFTVMIVGNYNQPESAVIYSPVERVFHASLPATEQFLSFDRLWEIYEDETPMPNNENFYEYAVPDERLQLQIKQLAWNAYVACRGKSYTRVDIRMDKLTGKLYVLEVNAQCGLSEDENYTYIGAIIKASNTTFTKVIEQIITNAIQ
jgi:D-alanine-D-alanine ligase